MTGLEFLGPAALQAFGSIGSGFLAGQAGGNRETKMQRTQRKLVDQLINSLTGEGPYSDLFNPSEEAFQKSFVEPAQSRFRNQIAPQIQQSFIASGQQRGTALDDQLLRAGVDLDSMLNQQYYNFQQDALNRQQNTIGNILGQGAGAPRQSTTGQDIMGALSGYLSSPGFADTTSNLFRNQNTTAPPPYPIPQARKGYERPEWLDYKLNDARWGY